MSAALDPRARATRPGDAASIGKAGRRHRRAAALRAGGGEIRVPLDELTIYQPNGIAVAATLKSSDPTSSLHQMPTFLAGLGNRWDDYDGTYIRLVDKTARPSGDVLDGPISSGSVVSREDLAGCSPVAHHGPTPPPCPAK